MKKTLLLKKLGLLSLVLSWMIQSGFGQAIMVENFDYPDGALITDYGWVAHSGGGTQPITVNSTGLTFTGYASSGIGLAALVDNNGEDDHRSFTPINSGSVYCAFLINVTAPANGYFLHFGDDPIGTTFRGKVFFNGSSGGTFNIGLTNGSNTVTGTAGPYNTATTYLVVLKYTVIEGSNNDEVSLFVIDGAVPGTEPGTPTIGPLQDAGQSDLANVATIALRQFTAGENFVIDGIRIATTWSDAISDTDAPVASFNPSDGATDVLTDVTPTITFDEPVEKTDGTSLENADLASLITFKKTDASGEDIPFTATIDANKKIITVTPSSGLDNTQVYYLGVGPVEDVAGNESTLQSAQFTTISASSPTITVTYPNGGEVVYAGDTETITWTTTNFAPGEDVMIEVYEYDSEDLIWEWMTLVDDTPNDGEYDVLVGPVALYGTDYVIRISGVTNGAVDESDAPFTVISTADNLADLRKYPVNNVIKYTGVATVTYARTSYNQKYIQDATAAILIHDPSGFVSGTYDVGDGIMNVEGKIDQYGGLLELVPLAATGESATGIVIIPAVTDITTLTSDDQCKLIKVQKLKFADPTQYDAGGLFVSGKNYDLTGLSNNNFAYRTQFSESDYIGTAVPTGFFDAVVLVGQYGSQIQITARNLADFTILSSAKAITAFDFNGLSPAVIGTIDQGAKTVSLEVPSETDVTGLVPTIVVSDNATISPLSGVSQDFTSPVSYTVTAQDGTTQVYVVTVSVSTGIGNTLDNNILIYPVPASTVLNIKNIINVRSVEILDVTGKVIIKLNDLNQQEIKIPVSNLTRGMYFLKLTTHEGKIIRRFIKS